MAKNCEHLNSLQKSLCLYKLLSISKLSDFYKIDTFRQIRNIQSDFCASRRDFSRKAHPSHRINNPIVSDVCELQSKLIVGHKADE